MDINETKLSEIPEIKELLKVLSDNGLLKEENNVKHLVSYIEDMENKILDMTIELRATTSKGFKSTSGKQATKHLRALSMLLQSAWGLSTL